MKLITNCEVCDKEFIAIKSTQKYCCRSHFKRAYYLRQKAILAEEVRRPKYPSMNCGICHIKSELDFDPVKYPKKFEEHKCPHCEYARPHHWLTNTHFVFTYSRVETVDGITTEEIVVKTEKRPF